MRRTHEPFVGPRRGRNPLVLRHTRRASRPGARFDGQCGADQFAQQRAVVLYQHRGRAVQEPQTQFRAQDRQERPAPPGRMRTVPAYPTEVLNPGRPLLVAPARGGRRAPRRAPARPAPAGEWKLIILVGRVVQARRHAPFAQDIVPKGEPSSPSSRRVRLAIRASTATIAVSSGRRLRVRRRQVRRAAGHDRVDWSAARRPSSTTVRADPPPTGAVRRALDFEQAG